MPNSKRTRKAARPYFPRSFELAMSRSLFVVLARRWAKRTVWRRISKESDFDQTCWHVASRVLVTPLLKRFVLFGWSMQQGMWPDGKQWSSDGVGTPLFLVSVSNFAAGLAPSLGKRRLFNVQPPWPKSLRSSRRLSWLACFSCFWLVRYYDTSILRGFSEIVKTRTQVGMHLRCLRDGLRGGIYMMLGRIVILWGPPRA